MRPYICQVSVLCVFQSSEIRRGVNKRQCKRRRIYPAEPRDLTDKLPGPAYKEEMPDFWSMQPIPQWNGMKPHRRSASLCLDIICSMISWSVAVLHLQCIGKTRVRLVLTISIPTSSTQVLSVLTSQQPSLSLDPQPSRKGTPQRNHGALCRPQRRRILPLVE